MHTPQCAVAAEREAWEVGRSRGWDHANYVNAYGGDMNAKPNSSEIGERFSSVESFYLSGYEEGVSNFRDGLNVDGSWRN